MKRPSRLSQPLIKRRTHVSKPSLSHNKAIEELEMATKKDPTGKAVPAGEVVDPKEFRKPNETIGLRVMEGRLSLLTRKVFNVMMYHAQELRVPGHDAPIDTPAAKKYFWIPLCLTWLAMPRTTARTPSI